MADPLLELPAIRSGVARIDALELGLRLFKLLPCAGLIDVPGGHCGVDERDRSVLEHLEEPGAGRELAHLAVAQVNRVEPACSIATSGACRASTPISPAAPGTISISASPSNAGPSGVTTETGKSG